MTDDRDALRAMDIPLLSHRDVAENADLVEARIVVRTGSVIVARVVVERDARFHRRRRQRDTRAVVLLLHPETGLPMARFTTLARDARAVADGLGAIATYVEDVSAKRPGSRL